MKFVNKDAEEHYDRQKKSFIEQLSKLPKAMLSQKLEQNKLVTSGDKYAQAERLWQNIHDDKREEYVVELAEAAEIKAASQKVRRNEVQKKRRHEKRALKLQQAPQRRRTDMQANNTEPFKHPEPIKRRHLTLHSERSESAITAAPTTQPAPVLIVTCSNVGCNLPLLYQPGKEVIRCWSCNAQINIPRN
jgi:LSD1 subclass zinc finger protein